MIDKKHIGYAPPPTVWTVEKGRIAFFAKVIGLTDPIHTDEAAAKAAPTGLGVFPVHAVAGVGYGNGFAGNSHRHAPDAWMPAMKYVVEELRADVNARDNNGYTPMHHAAARGDNEMILYLVSKGEIGRAHV